MKKLDILEICIHFFLMHMHVLSIMAVTISTAGCQPVSLHVKICPPAVVIGIYLELECLSFSIFDL